MRKLFVPKAPAVILPKRRGVFVGERRTCDVAFTYRMGAGFPGDVNRTHPFSVEPTLIYAASPPTAYGQAVVIAAGTNAARPVADGDDALTTIYGVTVRPYPTQQQSGGMSSPFGNQVPPTSGVIDVLRIGYIMVNMFGTPNKGDSLYVWADAAGGGEVPGQFTTDSTAGSTIGPVPGNFNGPPDANGVGEIYVNLSNAK